ncbi:Inosine-uridine preferring nucleoside hydrolase [Stenotrophomonas maltophilia D457]|nr:Inosine-uridine preferring nucleoside hydrolase [Stenotrophomonas maltophilia D457]
MGKQVSSVIKSAAAPSCSAASAHPTVVGGSAGLAALHLQKQPQRQKPAFRGMAGRCGWAGHAVNPSLGARWRHPWRQRSCPPTPPHPRQVPHD